MTYGDPAEEHFKNLETQYQESLQKLRALCDEHVPANLFVQVTSMLRKIKVVFLL